MDQRLRAVQPGRLSAAAPVPQESQPTVSVRFRDVALEAIGKLARAMHPTAFFEEASGGSSLQEHGRLPRPGPEGVALRAGLGARRLKYILAVGVPGFSDDNLYEPSPMFPVAIQAGASFPNLALVKVVHRRLGSLGEPLSGMAPHALRRCRSTKGRMATGACADLGMVLAQVARRPQSFRIPFAGPSQPADQQQGQSQHDRQDR